MELLWITESIYLEDYKMKVRFNNGAWRIFDFSKLFGTHKCYDRIVGLDVFKNFTLDGWTISWLDNEVDVAPEYIYEHSVAA